MCLLLQFLKKKKPSALNKGSRKRDKNERTKAFPGILPVPPGLCDCKHCTALINRNRWAKMSGGRVTQPGAVTWRGSNAGAYDGWWQLPVAQAVAAVSCRVKAKVDFYTFWTLNSYKHCKIRTTALGDLVFYAKTSIYLNVYTLVT